MKDVLLKKGLLLSFFAALAIAGCSKMDDTFKEFTEGGQIVYAGKADKAIIQPGRSRMVLAWPMPSDPKVVKARIIWNNGTDSLDIPITREDGQDSIKVPFNDLAEGPYTFDIYTFDNEGNRSVKVEVRGRVYGTNYEQTLLSRPIDMAELYVDTLKIEWGAPPDTTVIGSEVIYKDINGNEQVLFVPVSTLLTQILDFPVQDSITHRTLYLPGRFAIDTFYTAYAKQKVKGPPIEISKAGWTITASSEDAAKGRVAKNLIDGDLGNLFVNQIKAGNTYPHWVEINMGTVVNEIEGFYFYQRNINPTKDLEILTSNDGTTWESLGQFTLDKTGSSAGEPVRVQLGAPLSFQYFKFIFLNDYGNSVNVNMHEAGVYTR